MDCKLAGERRARKERARGAGATKPSRKGESRANQASPRNILYSEGRVGYTEARERVTLLAGGTLLSLKRSVPPTSRHVQSVESIQSPKARGDAEPTIRGLFLPPSTLFSGTFFPFCRRRSLGWCPPAPSCERRRRG